MAAILPLVKRPDAAVIAHPNDADEIPMEPRSGSRVGGQDRSGGDTGVWHRHQDIVIDPLPPCRSAPTPRSGQSRADDDPADRRPLGLNMTCGASNVSFGMPGRHALNAALAADRHGCGMTRARDHGRPDTAGRRVRARRRSPSRTDMTVGRDGGSGSPTRKQAATAAARRHPNAGSSVGP